MLIVIEGVDGSGKQTHTEKIFKRLADEGQKVKQIHFPNYQSDTSALVKMYLSGQFGGNPNDVNPYVASSFYAVDRIATYLLDREKFFERDGIIISDRYTTSNAVHQAGKLCGNERDAYLDWLFDFEYNILGLPSPDLVVFLDMPPKHAKRLIKNRCNKINGCAGKDIHETDTAHLEGAYENALYVAKKYGWSIVNCVSNGEVRSIDSINDEIYRLIKGVR